MADEFSAPTLRDRGFSVAQGQPQVVQSVGTPAALGANTAAFVTTALSIPIQRGQIFVPVHLSGQLSSLAVTGTGAGQINEAFIQVNTLPVTLPGPGFTIIRNWLATFAGTQLVGGGGGAYQVEVLDEIDPLEAVFATPVITSLQFNALANVSNNTAITQTYTLMMVLKYYMRFIQQ